MVRVPTDREPTHPGEMLLQDFLMPLGMTQRDLATAIHVPFQRVNEIVRGRRGVTPSTALRLSKFFGTSPDFWLNLQLRWDLYHAQRAEAEQIDSIQPPCSPSLAPSASAQLLVTLLLQVGNRIFTLIRTSDSQLRSASWEAAMDYRVWTLFVIYGACFGVELTINNIACALLPRQFRIERGNGGAHCGPVRAYEHIRPHARRDNRGQGGNQTRTQGQSHVPRSRPAASESSCCCCSPCPWVTAACGDESGASSSNAAPVDVSTVAPPAGDAAHADSNAASAGRLSANSASIAELGVAVRRLTTRGGTAGRCGALAFLVALGVLGTALTLAYDRHWGEFWQLVAWADTRAGQPGLGSTHLQSDAKDGPVRPDHCGTHRRKCGTGHLAALRRELQHGPTGRPLHGPMGHDDPR